VGAYLDQKSQVDILAVGVGTVRLFLVLVFKINTLRRRLVAVCIGEGSVHGFRNSSDNTFGNRREIHQCLIQWIRSFLGPDARHPSPCTAWRVPMESRVQ
jgi:hypothetical protein